MKKFIAIFMTLALVLALAACGKTQEPETTTIENTTETTTVEDTTATTEAATTEASTETTTEESTTSATNLPLKAPNGQVEILAMYNNAINNAYDKKVGFEKERYTDNEKMDMSIALKAFKSLVEKFVGIGDANKYTEKVTKGQWDEDTMHHYLRKSTLTEADLTNATFKQDGDEFVITLYVKGGDSVGSESKKYTNAPIDKCGICVGNQDKGYFDHKTGEVIYDAIAGTYAGANISESYSNAKVELEINPATGEIDDLEVTFDIAVSIDISVGSGTASGTTHIEYDDFVY